MPASPKTNFTPHPSPSLLAVPYTLFPVLLLTFSQSPSVSLFCFVTLIHLTSLWNSHFTPLNFILHFIHSCSLLFHLLPPPTSTHQFLHIISLSPFTLRSHTHPPIRLSEHPAPVHPPGLPVPSDRNKYDSQHSEDFLVFVNVYASHGVRTIASP